MIRGLRRFSALVAATSTRESESTSYATACLRKALSSPSAHLQSICTALKRMARQCDGLERIETASGSEFERHRGVGRANDFKPGEFQQRGSPGGRFNADRK